jgi:hypothetical protein
VRALRARATPISLLVEKYAPFSIWLKNQKSHFRPKSCVSVLPVVPGWP